ncbi:uncharacterized protein LOC130736800 [Lotus japonicus]|uniref:uncharacterized protein LOC130736800 n=1 Tax=Lotus japonicus TaxID=34305 RepID=UPI002583B6B5|nr:uncharacterized protein LOC130736800 [Lotus japonicus]
MTRFSPKFNTEGDGKKRGGAENQTEGAQAPKRRKLVKVSSVAPGSAVAGSSNPGAQPTTVAVSKGKNVVKASAKASAATTTEFATATTPHSATGDTATVAAAKSTTVGATTATGNQSSTAGRTTNTSQPSAVEKLAAINATTAAATSDEKTLACLLRAGCIFAHAFDNFNAAAAETERLRAENAKHQEDAAAWKKRFDKLLDQAGKEKVQADKLIDQAEKDLAARGEALAAKESELEVLRAELESAKKALAEQEEKSAESLASAKADLEAVMRATSEEIKKADEARGAALAAKDAEIISHLAKIKELEGELAVERAKVVEAREQAADIAYDNRERGFYLAKDQAQHLFSEFLGLRMMKGEDEDHVLR